MIIFKNVESLVSRERERGDDGGFMITKEEKQLFVEVYMENYASLRIAEGEDLHREFANRLGISRQEAKSLCHRINYTLGFPVFH